MSLIEPLSANEPGLYRYGKSRFASRRNVSRDPNAN